MHIVVLAATLLALLCLPCLVAAMICADELFDRTAWTRGRRRETRALRRLDRSLDNDNPAPTPCPGTRGPTIEQIAADLRRLDQQRHRGISTESVAWRNAVVRAYDDRLCLAGRCLGVAERLLMLEGIDRDIERLRIEAELQAAGLVLRCVAQPPPDRLP